MRSAQRSGFTLVEVVVVMALAGVVTMGLVTFYLYSQSTWIDASTQALTQRDATGALEAIGATVWSGNNATVLPAAGDSTNSDLFVYDAGGTLLGRYYWDPADSLIHWGDDVTADRGPLVPSRAERFTVSLEDSLGLVHIDSLRLRSSMGQPVSLSSTFGMYNRTP
ncbi:MAG: type II secretion system protein [Candidatus Eisenbacteria bacterium]|uniref:Type II secretion system protein n=1 Tax=Eiseniibacteriota bacterium TaxID=2212470 RepID=A0A849SL32_UNCEI|nr:type II secretion system protein [Candidatus Eisenbacteria bacterium]